MSIIQDRFNLYTQAIGDKIKSMTAPADANQKKLMEAYKNWLATQTPGAEGAAGPQKFQDWVKNPANKPSVDATGATAADIEAAIATAEKDEGITKAYNTLIKDGKYAAEKAGSWLGDNWPMLAAIAAPLLLGNFFEIGTIGTLLVGVLGLGAAAVFSNENSILAPVGKFIREKTNNLFGLLPPQQSQGQSQNQGQGNGGAGTDVTKQPDAALVATVQKVEGAATDPVKGDMVAANAGTITIDGKPRQVALVGYSKDGKTTFDSFRLLGADGKTPVGDVIPLPAAMKGTPQVVVPVGIGGVVPVTVEMKKMIGGDAATVSLVKASDVKVAAAAEKAAAELKRQERETVSVTKAGTPNEVKVEAPTKVKVGGKEYRLAVTGTAADPKNGTMTTSKLMLVDDNGNQLPATPAIPGASWNKATSLTIKDGKIDSAQMTALVSDMQKFVAAEEEKSRKPAAPEKPEQPKIDPKLTATVVKFGTDPKEVLLDAGTIEVTTGSKVRVALVGKSDNDATTGKVTFDRFVTLDSAGKPSGTPLPLRGNIQRQMSGSKVEPVLLTKAEATVMAADLFNQSRTKAEEPTEPKRETKDVPPAPTPLSQDVKVKIIPAEGYSELERNGAVKTDAAEVKLVDGTTRKIALAGSTTYGSSAFDSFVLLDKDGNTGKPIPLPASVKASPNMSPAVGVGGEVTLTPDMLKEISKSITEVEKAAKKDVVPLPRPSAVDTAKAMQAAVDAYKQNKDVIDTVGFIGAPFSFGMTSVVPMVLKGAAAQSDFVSGKVNMVPPNEPRVDQNSTADVDVEFTAASETDPNVTRTFRGKAKPDGTIEVTEVLMTTEKGQPQVALTLKSPLKLSGVASEELPAEQDGYKTIKLDTAKIKSDPEFLKMLKQVGPTASVKSAVDSNLIVPPPGFGPGQQPENGMGK